MKLGNQEKFFKKKETGSKLLIVFHCISTRSVRDIHRIYKKLLNSLIDMSQVTEFKLFSVAA